MDPPPTDIYTLSLHDALPICRRATTPTSPGSTPTTPCCGACLRPAPTRRRGGSDRKSTRLNSSHGSISYAVFCLKKKNTADTRLEHDQRHRHEDARDGLQRDD